MSRTIRPDSQRVGEKHTHLDHHLRSSIWVRWADWAALWNWDHAFVPRSIAINGSRRREYDVLHAVLLHGAEERDGAPDIDAIILDRNLSRFSNRLKLRDFS